jgi:hypothetical protein
MAKTTPGSGILRPQNETLDPSNAVAFAEKHGGHYDYDGYCSRFTENALTGHGGVYDSAKDWYNASVKNKVVNTTKLPPAGAAVFYQGDPENGHVAVSAGGGYVWSTGVKGKVQKVRYDQLWGGNGSGTYLGWTSKVGGKYVGVDRSNLKPLGSPISTPKVDPVTRARAVKTSSRAQGFSDAAAASSASMPSAPNTTSAITAGVMAQTPSPAAAPSGFLKMVAY